ncbi:type VI secretion system-associated FHA domain protein TagH [Vibrio sp. JC009]|uniref:type VI secretion system-associated FHA domain protein TagH n=1 Tax=Vibrio sp. JC009 TaxID=2912314 RepID=UPI0023B11BCB|nr:type VI secretion system-associated FHA domain protein TagH [Vibrio sp. JC009]WED24553.1 type VI secretion system-associated FHA domain protein TagH [Vibrio sp. JC009]
MTKNDSVLLTMYVMNVQELGAGLCAHSQWSGERGVVGSQHTAFWLLKDKGNQIKPEHCELVLCDGEYCLKDISGETFINSSHMPLGIGNMVKLSHKDELKIGPYIIRVLLGQDYEHESHQGSLLNLVGDKGADSLLADAEHGDLCECVHVSTTEPARDIDPLAVIERDRAIMAQESSDVSENQLLAGEQSRSELEYTPQADSGAEISSFMDLSKIQPGSSKELLVNKTKLDLLEQEMASGSAGCNHLLSAPIFDGLGVRLEQANDVQDIQLLSSELGQSLKVCISGLLGLHQDFSSGRFGSINKNLQPIEDNPLRMGKSYQETVQTMFGAEKSQVHLSAPSALEESIKNISEHNEAVQYAISEALSYLLTRFSPEILLRRFNQYERENRGHANSSESWPWQMYCNYYQELTSNHQQGFEKLFWEIFEQAYDRKIRDKQLER